MASAANPTAGTRTLLKILGISCELDTEKAVTVIIIGVFYSLTNTYVVFSRDCNDGEGDVLGSNPRLYKDQTYTRPPSSLVKLRNYTGSVCHSGVNKKMLPDRDQTK